MHVAVRCTSWEAIFWAYLYYLDKVPQTSWRQKDFMSYSIVTSELGEATVKRLRKAFANRKG
nr:hypothetical protein [Candidatus Entotheonella palauensis]